VRILALALPQLHGVLDRQLGNNIKKWVNFMGDNHCA
jgi:hypothetical protein